MATSHKRSQSTAKRVDDAWKRLTELRKKHDLPQKQAYDYDVLVRDWEIDPKIADEICVSARLVFQHLGKLPWVTP